jgi:hypothetical protein
MFDQSVLEEQRMHKAIAEAQQKAMVLMLALVEHAWTKEYHNHHCPLSRSVHQKSVIVNPNILRAESIFFPSILIVLF